MMAEGGVGMDLLSEQELTCSICLDVFSDPVSTPCGHNFCQACIGGYWASSAVCSCPLCKREFEERPLLSINRVMALFVNQYRTSLYGDAAKEFPLATGTEALAVSEGVPGPAGGQQVLCDICTGRKQVAVSSCLTCTASYCQEHVQPHRTADFYRNHRLLLPQDALRGRTCELHNRLLEVFCRTCQQCICAICVLGDHRTHTTVSVQTERLSKQKLIGKTELEIQNLIESRKVRLSEVKDKLQGIKNYADGEQEEVEKVLAELERSVERIRSELLGGIQDKRGAVETKGEGLVTRLGAELQQLQEKREKLGAQATSQDHISFLQHFKEASAPLALPLIEDPEEEQGLSLHFRLGEVKGALRGVWERLEEIRGGETRPRGSQGSISSGDMLPSESLLSVAMRGSTSNLRKNSWSMRDMKKIKPSHGVKKVRPYLDDVTLNPVTAYPFLILSEDRKQVKRGEKLQSYRNNPHRFDVWSCIVAKEGFNTGRHYWEVNVGKNTDWKLGVVRESAHRKGLFDMSPSNGYFVIWWSGGELRALTNPPLTKIKGSSRLRQVGVFLDVEEGQLTFYNSKTGTDLYTFTGSQFGERMFPLLGTGDREVPLVLMTTHSSSFQE